MLPNIQLDPEEQNKILYGLDTAFADDSIDFSVKLRNYYNMQTSLVAKYGRDGLMLLLDSETRVYEDSNTKRSLEIMHYSEIPETSPWSAIRHLKLEEAIRKVWKAYPVEFVNTLVKYAKDLFAIYEGGKWYLAYPYETMDYTDTKYYGFLGGREPQPEAQLPAPLLEAGWKMPSDLQALYAVHGNFGGLSSALRDDNSNCISTAEKLETSLSFLEDKVKQWNCDYSFFDLMTFFEDGVGNSVNFYKAMPEGDSYMTVDWDHETKDISALRSLEDFIDDQFGEGLRGNH